MIALGVAAFVAGACRGTGARGVDEAFQGPLPSEELKQLREELGWTQTEMARFFGVAQSTVNAWELAGGRPRLRRRGAAAAPVGGGCEEVGVAAR